MYYKLKILKNNTVKVVDIVEDKISDDLNYLYATEEELKLINPKILDMSDVMPNLDL